MPKVTQLIRGRAEACGLSLSMMPSPGRWGCTLGSLQSNWGVKTHPPHLLENNVRQSSDIMGGVERVTQWDKSAAGCCHFPKTLIEYTREWIWGHWALRTEVRYYPGLQGASREGGESFLLRLDFELGLKQ